jgi:acetyl esterase/lipase
MEVLTKTLVTRFTPIARPMRALLFILSTVAAVPAAWGADEKAPRLPVESFFQNAELGAVKLSPSGRWLAIAAGAKVGRVVLAVVDLEATVPASTVVANFEAADVRSFDWVNDERLVFNLLDLQSGMGAQGFGPGLYSVKRDGSEMRLLIRPRRDFVRRAGMIGSAPLEETHELLWIPRTGGEEVIVGEIKLDTRWEGTSVAPKRLNVVTGRTSPLLDQRPDHVYEWMFDPSGQPRVAHALFQGQHEVFWSAPGQTGWRSIAKYTVASAEQLQPWFVDGNGQLFVRAYSSTGGGFLTRFDFNTGAPEPKPLVSTPGFDFQGQLLGDWTLERPLGVRVDTDARSTVWFDAGMKKLQALADQRLPGRINELTCRRCASDGSMLVFSYSDQDPGRYFLYRPSKDQWESIGAVRSDINARQMSQLDFHRIRSRDGLDLPVWVTTPPGKSAAPRPAVVLVHGGPWVRGTSWHWEADAQFLASRGYVVIEPEFRGSTGYGWDHFRKGWKQWGTTMQDDVADAVRWAADQKLVDPKRVCIAGASYGGYATLMGLVRYPDTYRCGVAWVAVTDPRLLFEDSWASDIHTEAREYSMPEMLGDRVKDAEMLKAAAPSERAAEIRVPVLMAFGGEDRRVPLEHGTRMRAAMKAAGHEPEWVVYNDEGHGWLKVANRIDFWQRVERFLDAQLQASPAKP